MKTQLVRLLWAPGRRSDARIDSPCGGANASALRRVVATVPPDAPGDAAVAPTLRWPPPCAGTRRWGGADSRRRRCFAPLRWPDRRRGDVSRNRSSRRRGCEMPCYVDPTAQPIVGRRPDDVRRRAGRRRRTVPTFGSGGCCPRASSGNRIGPACTSRGLGGVVHTLNASTNLLDVTLGGRASLLRYGTEGVRAGRRGSSCRSKGAAFPRLNLDENWDLDAADFRFGLPLVYGREKWQAKFSYYHLSSHMGDEFAIRENALRRPDQLQSRCADAWRCRSSRMPAWRLYAEAGWAFHYDVSSRGRFSSASTSPSRGRPGAWGTPFFADQRPHPRGGGLRRQRRRPSRAGCGGGTRRKRCGWVSTTTTASRASSSSSTSSKSKSAAGCGTTSDAAVARRYSKAAIALALDQAWLGGCPSPLECAAWQTAAQTIGCSGRSFAARFTAPGPCCRAGRGCAGRWPATSPANGQPRRILEVGPGTGVVTDQIIAPAGAAATRSTSWS